MNAASTPDAKKTLLELLGDSMTAGDREVVEQAFFEQDALFEALLAAEDELVDDLVTDRLPTDTKTILENRPELVPGLKTRTALSHKLSQLAARRQAAERLERRSAPQSRPYRWVRPLLAAVVLTLTAIGPWLWWRFQTASDVGPDDPTTWVVSPSSARGPTLPQLRLPPTGGSVTLILELDRLPENPGPLRGTLTDDRGVMRDLGSALHIETFPWGIGVKVMIPKGAWRPGPQTLELSDARADGTVEPVATYQFELLQG